MTKKSPTHTEKIIASKDAKKPRPHSERMNAPGHKEVCDLCRTRAGVLDSDPMSVAREKLYGRGREPEPENTAELGPNDILGDATEAFNIIPTVADFDLALRAATDASPFFKVLALYNITGALMARRWYVQLGQPLYGPHYTILVGPSGISRKSTVKNYAQKLLNEVTDYHLRSMSAHGSGEGLIESLATAGMGDADELKTVKAAMALGDFTTLRTLNLDQRRLQVFEDELSSVLKKGKAEHSTLHQTFMEGYGCPETMSVTTRSKSSVHVYHPILGILACSTPDRIKHDAEIVSWTDGLFNRFVAGYSPARPAGSLALSDEPDPDRWGRVVATLRTIYRESLEGRSERLYLDPTAEEMWAELSRKHEAELHQRNDIQRGAIARVTEHCMRYALIIAVLDYYGNEKNKMLIENTGDKGRAGEQKVVPIADNPEHWPVFDPQDWKVLRKVPLRITAEHLELAYELSLYVKATTLRLVGTLTAGNRNDVQDRIIAALTRRPNMQTREIAALVKRHVNGVVELKRDYLVPMHDAEMIEGDDRAWRIKDYGV